MKKYIVLCFLMFIVGELSYTKLIDKKTDKILTDENLIPKIELIENVFQNQNIHLKSDNINKNGNIISLILMIESENYTSWAADAIYEITLIDRHPSHQEIYHYWCLKNAESVIYEEERCVAYLLTNQAQNDEPVDCVIGRLDKEFTSVYFMSYIKGEYILSDLILEIENIKELFV